MFTSQIKWWLQYPRRSQGILPSQFVRNIQYANGLVKALILRFLSPLYKCPGYLVRRSEHAIPFPSRNIYYHRTHYTNRFQPLDQAVPNADLQLFHPQGSTSSAAKPATHPSSPEYELQAHWIHCHEHHWPPESESWLYHGIRLQALRLAGRNVRRIGRRLVQPVSQPIFLDT